MKRFIYHLKKFFEYNGENPLYDCNNNNKQEYTLYQSSLNIINAQDLINKTNYIKPVEEYDRQLMINTLIKDLTSIIETHKRYISTSTFYQWDENYTHAVYDSIKNDLTRSGYKSYGTHIYKKGNTIQPRRFDVTIYIS